MKFNMFDSIKINKSKNKTTSTCYTSYIHDVYDIQFGIFEQIAFKSDNHVTGRCYRLQCHDEDSPK